MLICPVCGQENSSNALTCVRCFTAFPRSGVAFGNTAPLEAKPVGPKLYVPRRTGDLAPNSVALYVGDSDQPLVLEVLRQVILGRHDARSGSQPRVDLTPYGAYEKGVSRLHVALRRSGGGELMVEDLASTNGTSINDTPTEPYMPRPIKSGDHVKLSKLDIEVRFRTTHSAEEKVSPDKSPIP